MVSMAAAQVGLQTTCLPRISAAGLSVGSSATNASFPCYSFFEGAVCESRARAKSVCGSKVVHCLLRSEDGSRLLHRQRRQRVVSCALDNSTEDAGVESSSGLGEERRSENEERPAAPASTSGRPSDPEGSGALYWFIGGLASIGVLETAYLTYEKLTGGPVACSLGGGGAGGCSDVLDSEYGTLFGVPLSLFGFAAYSSVVILSQLVRTRRTSDTSNPDLSQWLLLAATSAMAAASGYFMYVLTGPLAGATCTYCVGSAVLSASLLVATLSGFKGSDLQRAAAPQLGLSVAVVLALSLAFADVSTDDIDLAPTEPQITTVSSNAGTALAKHLKAIGAKMYGAFWCSHCFEQKQAFGQEAMQYVDYVECYPEGYRRGVTFAKPCQDAKIEGFPTWIINGKLISGEQDLKQLAIASQFDPSTIPR